MSDKIKFNEIVDGDVIKGLKAVSEGLKILDKELKDVAKSAKTVLDATKGTDFSSLKKLESTFKDVNKVQKESVEVNKEQVKLKKQLQAATDEEVKGKIRLQKATKAQKAALQDQLILQDKEAGTLQKIAAQSRILRRERERLNLDTKKGQLRLKAINLELDKNNKKIVENSDKLKKQKLNVGNYTDSIKEAASASGLFGGVIGKLNQIQATFSALTKANTVEEEVNTVAKETNTVATVQLTVAQRGLNAATGAWTKGLKALKIALAASGIGAIVLILGSLVSFLTRSQDGVDGLAKAFAGLTSVFDVVIDRLSQIGGGVVDLVKGFATFDSDLISKGLDSIATSLDGIGDELEREIELSTNLKDLTIELTREQKLFTAEQAKNLTQVKELTLVAKDKLAADQDRLDAVKEINRIEIETSVKQLALQERALAASLDSVSADKERLELGPEQLKFIERIKNGQIDAADAVKLAADFTLSSAAGEEALFEIIEKVVAQEQARQSLLDKQATTRRRTAQITQEIANKESRALLQESRLRLEIAKDEDEQIDNRVKALQEARDFEIDAARVRLEANLINEKEFEALRLTVFKRTQEAIEKLFFKTADKMDKSREASIRKQIETINAIEQEQFKGQIDALDRQLENDELSQKERLDLINKSNELRKNQLIAQSEFELSNDNLTAEKKELIAEKLKNDLANLEGDKLKAVQDENDKILESDKKLADERRELIKQAATEVLQAFAERAKAREAEIDDEISQNEKRQDRLRTLSQSGVQNAEQSLADANVREAELRKQKEEQIQRQKQIEAGLAALEIFAAELQGGATPTQALASTVTNVTLLRKVISSLPAFESGIDNTSSLNGVGGNGVDGRGGFHAILHPNEAVFNATDTAKKGGLTNSEAGNVLEAYNKGYLNNWNMGIAPQSTDNSIALAAGLSEMNGHIKDMKKSIGESKKYELDSFMNWAKVTTKEGNTRTTDFNDTKGLF